MQSSTVTFRLPDLGEDVTEGEVVQVLVSAGDMVRKDQTVIELETEKALLEVPSPVSGRIVKVHTRAGATLKVNDVIVTIEEVAGVAATSTEKSDPPDPPAPLAQAKKSASVKSAPPAGPPPSARRQEAEVVEVPKESRSTDTADAAALAKSATGGPAAPSTRRLARELGVTLSEVEGSGSGGRITRQDVLDFVKSRLLAMGKSSKGVGGGSGGAPASGPGIESPALPDFSRWGPIERRALSGIRKKTMKQLSLSWSLIPHVTQVDEADITELESLRARHAQRAAEKGGKLTVTVFVMKAVVSALKAFPQFNASIDPGREELILKNYYHLGIAVDTEHGLLVPAVRDVDRKHLVELSAELLALSERARSRKVTLDDLRGATFTITNLGGLGGTAFTPIINWPEVAILGLARTQKRLVMGEEGPETRLMLPLCLSYDHRVIDGADAVRFTRKVAAMLQDPAMLLLEP